MKTIYIRHEEDLYEIPLSNDGTIKRIIRYHTSQDRRGEEVEFYRLPPNVFQQLNEKLNGE